MPAAVRRSDRAGHRDGSSHQFPSEVEILARKNVLSGLIALWVVAVSSPRVCAADAAERRAEIGVQIGVRLADNDIVPDGINGLA